MRDSSGVDRPAWRPAMTPAEARKWSAGTSFPSVVYHVTSVEAARDVRDRGFDLDYRSGGRVWGHGVYAAIDDETRDDYLGPMGESGAVVPLALNLRRHLSVRLSRRSSLSPVFQVIAAIPEGVPRFNQIRNSTGDAASAITRLMVEAGYDGIVVIEPGLTLAVGENQVIVFDPKRVVAVVDHEDQ